jgi:hypothetical protein
VKGRGFQTIELEEKDWVPERLPVFIWFRLSRQTVPVVPLSKCHCGQLWTPRAEVHRAGTPRSQSNSVRCQRMHQCQIGLLLMYRIQWIDIAVLNAFVERTRARPVFRSCRYSILCRSCQHLVCQHLKPSGPDTNVLDSYSLHLKIESAASWI